MVLTVPYLFVESLQSAEDYLKTPYYATFVRIVRFLSMLISLYLPAFYIAVMEHHKNAVPSGIYAAMTGARRDIPFSLFGELVVILLIFEFIREVGVRTPGAVGDAVSIVGGLILGDAAISAGISSAPGHHGGRLNGYLHLYSAAVYEQRRVSAVYESYRGTAVRRSRHCLCRNAFGRAFMRKNVLWRAVYEAVLSAKPCRIKRHTLHASEKGAGQRVAGIGGFVNDKR